MKNKLSSVLFMIISLASLSFLAVSANAQSHTSPVPQKISESDAYTYFFRALTYYENLPVQTPSQKEKDFFLRFFQEKANLTEEHYRILKIVAANYVRDYKTTDKKNHSDLSTQYRNDLKVILDNDFDHFDKYITEEFSTTIVILNSSDPADFYGILGVYLDSSQRLIGQAGIIYIDSNFKDVQLMPCPASISATMTGPNVAESGMSSNECDETHPPQVLMISTSYFAGATYCINAIWTGEGIEGPTNRTVCTTIPKEPVIFIPGTMGSIINGPYQNQTVQYWTNLTLSTNPATTTVNNLTLDSSSPFYRGEGLYASDAFRQLSLFGVPLPIPIYKPLLDFLVNDKHYVPYDLSNTFPDKYECELSQRPSQPKLFVFPYDWRQDNNLSALKLKSYIQCVQQFYPGTKVNIIAHSMGGLLVRRYILQQTAAGQPHGLDKVFTLASPFLGAPESLYKIYTGGDYEGFSLAASPASIKFLAPSLPSLHQLFPSQTYHLFREGIIAEEGDADGNGIPDEVYSYDKIISQINTEFPLISTGVNTLPGDTGRNFHNFTGQDNWHSDQSGIKYYHILADQKALNTTDGLYVKRKGKCQTSGPRLTDCSNVKIYTPEKGPGDGTVPVISTAMGWAGAREEAPTSDLAPPQMRMFVRQSQNSSDDRRAKHIPMTQDDKVLNEIAYLLGVGPAPAPDPGLFELTRPNGSNREHFNLTTYDPSYYLTIIGKREVTVSDQAGNTAMIVDGILRNNVPGLTNYEMIGDNSAMLGLSNGNSYTIEFRTGIEPLHIELVNGPGNLNPLTAVRYNDVSLPANTSVRITFSQNNTTELRNDADNNGTFETLVPPTANLNGTAAADVTSPTVAITITHQPSATLATISAQDNQSGVSKIWYSLDGGQSFDLYTAPVSIPHASGVNQIQVFADDAAGNRSGFYQKKLNTALFDFDKDGKSDISVFRAGTWYIRQPSGNYVSTSFGYGTDLITPSDFDGDGKSDIAVFRPSNGIWYVIQSSSNTLMSSFYGQNGDRPVVGDYDNDGKCDIAVFRASNNNWYIKKSSDGASIITQFGVSGDKPVVGDFDGDGRSDPAVFRPSNNTWYILNSSLGYSAAQFGASGDKLVPGDYDGDGKTDIAVFRQSNGSWYIKASTGGINTYQFGVSTDQPVPGDYDGDGKLDIALFRPSTGVWYLQNSTAGFSTVQFGQSGDVPIETAYLPQ